MVLVDSYSKWVELFPLRTQEATEVASVLFTEIISRYGAPRAILSDRGRNFMSKLVKALSELFEIKRHYTSPYHPMTNGMTECKNSYILQALRAYCKGQQDDWPEILPGIMMAYRSTPCTQSTQFSPFFMLYGREMRLPIDTVLQPKDHLPQDARVYLSRILQNLEVCRKLAGENIKAAQDKYKHYYDKRTKVPDYHPAQRVWLYCTKVPIGKAPKLHRKWVGPYYITMLGPNHTYRLRNAKTNKEVRSLVNAMRLKPYYDPADRPTNPPEQLVGNEEELNPEELENNQNPENEDKMDQKDVNINERQENQTIRKVNSNNEDQETDRKTNEVKRKKISAKRPINQKSIQNGNNNTDHCKHGSGSNKMNRSKKQKTLPDKSTRNDDSGQKSKANKTKRAIRSKHCTIHKQKFCPCKYNSKPKSRRTKKADSPNIFQKQ